VDGGFVPRKLQKDLHPASRDRFHHL
jgi:hypothetical protein